MIRPDEENFTPGELALLALVVVAVLAVVGVNGWLAYRGATCGVG